MEMLRRYFSISAGRVFTAFTRPGIVIDCHCQTEILTRFVNGDALGFGMPVYNIDRMIRGTDQAFDDGSHIVYVNVAYNYESSELGDLMHDFTCGNPAEMRCAPLAERAAYLKKTEEGRVVMGRSWEEILEEFKEQTREEARRELQEEARREARQETVRRLLAAGALPPESIASALDIPLADVLCLAQESPAE